MSTESRQQREELEKPGYSHWQRLRQWLGTAGLTNQHKDSDLVSNESGETEVVDPSDERLSGRDMLKRLSRRLAEEAVAQAAEETKGDAGKPQYPFPRDLVLGLQVYHDPKVWRPVGVTRPLTVDEQYGEVVALLQEVDDALGISSAEP